MRLADYVFRTLADSGVKHVFMVAGGAAMFLNDAVAAERRIRYVCNHHEQACAMAAEAYARTSGRLGVVLVTAGPGGVNALNGVFGAWTDSVPLLVISGQVKRETLRSSYGLPGLRQLGDQEIDIVSMAGGITKYAAMISEPDRVRYQLEKAIHLATSGRPGPCWLDIPVDVQSCEIDPHGLAPFEFEASPETPPGLDALCARLIARLAEARRPVIIAGSGIHAAGARDLFRTTVDRLRIPVATAWAQDVIEHDHPCYCGQQGTIGSRAGNFSVQNADFVLIIGSRMSLRQVGYNWGSFAPRAYKVMVDIDPAEMSKPTLRIDLPIESDAARFLERFDGLLAANGYVPDRFSRWLTWCRERVAMYPPCLPRHRDPDRPLNPYHFLTELQRRVREPGDVIVCGDAMACIATFQTSSTRRGQRLFSNSGSGSMGYDLPAAIGAAVARGGERVVCIAGDGSIQMNLQELQTIVHHRLNIKVFVLSNDGYRSIQITQENFFGREVGAGPESGVSFPDIVAVARAYGIPAHRIDGHDFVEAVEHVLACDGPALCDVRVDPDQVFEPKLGSRRLPDGSIVTAPLEDMSPLLDREELARNMLDPDGTREP